MVPLKSVPNKDKSTPPKKSKRTQLPEGLPLIDINISTFDISTLAIILDIKKYIVNPIESTILKMSKDVIKTRIMQRKETIIHSLIYKITMLNVTSATIMVINPVNVDCQ
jgi:hypothetical protein